MNPEKVFQSDLKTLGLVPLDQDTAMLVNEPRYKEYIKVLFLPAGYEVQVDMTIYKVQHASLLFISPNQHLKLRECGGEGGFFIFYNQDFYCIQIHDKEVACDGLLFNNIHNMPVVELDKSDLPFFTYLFGQMADEFGLGDASLEEMIRTYLKQLFIKSARLWKKQHLNKQLLVEHTDVEFFRKFTLLVEEHYKKKHNVADYAELLFMAPKTITHKFKRLNLPQPNDTIKNRIVLEAKRLLAHTSLTAKEIGYELGYDDPAYFNRLFTLKTGQTPAGFRTKFLAAG
ncbi:MAG: helix-turn-helix domain-containing protein [Chitinophagaceae bacterium]|nr:MAG: helix-turn-helix domain-containing protein [Chitinophagaceae bacterium]